MDPIVLPMLVGVCGGAGISGTITYLTHRFTRSKPEKQPRAELTAAMRDEIEQTPRWWDKQFHTLLLEAGAEVIARISGDYYEGWRGEYRKGADHIALKDCTCVRCARTLKMKTERAEAKIPLHNGNPRFIVELQHALGVYADGIVGPHTMRAIEATPSDWKPRIPIGPDVWELYFELKLPELQAYVEQYKAQAQAQLQHIGVKMPKNVTSITKGGVTMQQIGPRTDAAIERYERKTFYEDDFQREVDFWESVPVQQSGHVPF